MKLAIIKPDELLKRLAIYTRQFQETIEVETFEEAAKEKKIDVLMSGQNELKSHDIIQLRSLFPNQKIILITESIEPFFEKTCIAHEILLISKEWDEREQLDTIQRVWFGLEEQTEYHNVITVHGTHRQVGVTQTALALGHTLGTFNYKTLVIGLNPYNSGEDHKKKSTYSLDQVYELILSNVINDGETLLPYLEKYDHFYYLPGNRDFYKAPTFEAKGIELLIKYAKEHFQVVLLDIGAFYDGYLALTSLQMSNTHVLISSQEQISIDEYHRWNEQILNRFDFYPKNRFQVVNKYASKAIITNTHLEEKHSIPILAQIPFFPEANDAIIEDGILFFSEYKAYNKAIEGIARALGDEITASTNYEKEPKSFLGNFFGRRKA